eukprot:CAMPEP_0184680696 /NCGR_PEP_ID=MMETSP0312-20130426/3596_1 /TAXON_ID=31354 /ORGANISM="Compsopogon coeruleus, Strain SAG 36.94" /LENGTH=1019 /DNA_ID=CAMNT_0027130995 /DNA_START=63 /DNA_END=3122 /DNA_ORIENTATION=+
MEDFSEGLSSVGFPESQVAVDTRALENELDDITRALSLGSRTGKWDDRVQAMERLSNSVGTHYNHAPGCFKSAMRPLTRALALQVSDLRSSVVRTACETVSVLAKAMGESFGDYISDHILPALLKATAVTIHVVAENALECLRVILTTSRPNTRVIRVIVDALAPRTSVPTRIVAAEAVGLLLEDSRSTESEDRATMLEAAIRAGLQDPSSIVRHYSRANYYLLEAFRPESAAKLRDQAPKRSLGGSRGRHPGRLTVLPESLDSCEQINPRNDQGRSTLHARRVVQDASPSSLLSWSEENVIDAPHGPQRVRTPSFNDSELSHRKAGRISSMGCDPMGSMKKPHRVPVRTGEEDDSRSINSAKAAGQPGTGIIALLQLVDSQRDWNARLHHLWILKSTIEKDGSRTLAPSALNRLFSTIDEPLSAHFRVTAGALDVLTALIKALDPIRLEEELSRHLSIVVKVLSCYGDQKEVVRSPAHEVVIALEHKLGLERIVSLLLLGLNECLAGRVKECRTIASNVGALKCFRDRLAKIDKYDFEWDGDLIDKTVRLLTPLIREKKRPIVKEAARDCLRELAKVVPPGVISIASETLSETDRSSLAQILDLETAGFEATPSEAAEDEIESTIASCDRSNDQESQGQTRECLHEVSNISTPAIFVTTQSTMKKLEDESTVVNELLSPSYDVTIPDGGPWLDHEPPADDDQVASASGIVRVLDSLTIDTRSEFAEGKSSSDIFEEGANSREEIVGFNSMSEEQQVEELRDDCTHYETSNGGKQRPSDFDLETLGSELTSLEIRLKDGEVIKSDVLKSLRTRTRQVDSLVNIERLTAFLGSCIQSSNLDDSTRELAVRFLAETLGKLADMDAVFESILLLCGTIPGDRRCRPTLRIRCEELLAQLFCSVDMLFLLKKMRSLAPTLEGDLLKTTVRALRVSIVSADDEEKRRSLGDICLVLFELMKSSEPEVRKEAVQTVACIVDHLGEATVAPMLAQLPPPMVRLVSMYQDREGTRRARPNVSPVVAR